MSTLHTFTTEVQLTTINCGCCGGSYAINERYREKKQESGGYWHCPYCETSWGYGKSEIQKVREELTIEQQRRHSVELERDSIRRSREEERKKMRRVSKGVCPCCSRSFTNLRKHMATQHPGADTARLEKDDKLAAKLK